MPCRGRKEFSIWQHFIKKKVGYRAVCKMCHKEMPGLSSRQPEKSLRYLNQMNFYGHELSLVQFYSSTPIVAYSCNFVQVQVCCHLKGIEERFPIAQFYFIGKTDRYNLYPILFLFFLIKYFENISFKLRWFSQ